MIAKIFYKDGTIELGTYLDKAENDFEEELKKPPKERFYIYGIDMENVKSVEKLK